MTQNPGFFSATTPSTAEAVAPATAGPRSAAPVKKLAKLSYKDQRRLEELEGLVASLPGEIARLEAVLADPGLYARDVALFDRTMKTLGDRRAELARSEDEWLILEEKREQLASQ